MGQLTSVNDYTSKVRDTESYKKDAASTADIIIAARNSSIKARQQADVVFEGKNDQNQFSAVCYELNRRGGRRLHAKAGQYNFNDAGTIYSGIHVTGDSWADDGAVFKMASGVNKDMFTHPNVGTDTTDDWFGFSDMYLDGDNDNNLTAGSCFKFGKVAVVSFERLAIQNFRENMLDIAGGSSQVAFSIFANILEMADWGGAAIKLGKTHNSNFSNINLTGGGTGAGLFGIQIDDDVDNINWVNLYLELAALTAGLYILGDVTEQHFANFQLTGTTGDGIQIASDAGGTPASINIKGGYAKMTGASGTAAVYLKGATNNVTISEFYARHQGGVGFQNEGTFNKLSVCTAELCNFEGFYDLHDGAAYNQYTGCNADRNGAGLSRRYGFHLEDALRDIVMGCRSGNSAGTNQTHGIFEDGTADYNQLSPNMLNGNVTAGILASGGNTVSTPNIVS